MLKSASILPILIGLLSGDLLNVPPNVRSKPSEQINVSLSMKITYFHYVDTQLYLAINLDEQWSDQRLSIWPEEQFIGNIQRRNMWIPELTFFETTAVTEVQPDASIARVKPDGTVSLTRRYYITTPSCRKGNLFAGPFTRFCKVQLGSFAYNKEELNIRWKRENGTDLVHVCTTCGINQGTQLLNFTTSVELFESKGELFTYPSVLLAVVV